MYVEDDLSIGIEEVNCETRREREDDAVGEDSCAAGRRLKMCRRRVMST